ncbi:sulfite exporter TauE/SafE family protein [Actinospica durhamensis]|nr:sulfite exporter TauE/SafE family protein [Actinospica durhamensis]
MSAAHDLAEYTAIFGAGMAAGVMNTVVGSGTLLTFPTLLAFGYSPVLANVSNTIGLVPGSFSGAYGYRAELTGQRRRILILGSASVLGGVLGAVLLLHLPASAFQSIVPVLIALALVLVIVQPRVGAWAARRRAERGTAHREAGGPLLWAGVFATGVYGGYFGAAQGVLLLALLGIAFTDSLQRVNGVKNILAGLVNGVAAVLFIALSHVSWSAAGLIAAGSIIGGQIGAKVGRKLPPTVLRGVIVCVGIAAIVKLLA